MLNFKWIQEYTNHHHQMGLLLHKSYGLFSQGLDLTSLASQSSLVLILLQLCDESAEHCRISSATIMSGFKSLGKYSVILCLSPIYCKTEAIVPIPQGTRQIQCQDVAQCSPQRISTQYSSCYCFSLPPPLLYLFLSFSWPLINQ